MYLKPLQSSSSTVTLGTPSVFQLRLPPLQQAMDIGNLLNNKSPQPNSRSSSTPFGTHLAPSAGYHSHHPSPNEANLDARSTASSEYMAQFSPPALARPHGLSPAVSAYQDPTQYHALLAGNDSGSNSTLPYDPVAVDDRSRVSATGAQHSLMSQPRDANTQGDSGELPKAFSCSTCHKGFARRSDLVRHGAFFSPYRPTKANLTFNRAHTQWCSSACLPTSWLWETIHPTLSSDCP